MDRAEFATAMSHAVPVQPIPAVIVPAADLKRLVEAAREMQKWRGGTGQVGRFQHERELDAALEPFDTIIAP